MSEYLLITAAGSGPVVSDQIRLDTLKRAIQYYEPMGCEVIVALGKTPFGAYALNELNLKSNRISYVTVPSKVRGALATADFAIAFMGVKRGSLHIAAGDTLFHDDSALSAMASLASSDVDAGTLVFDSDDQRHSFVTLDESGSVRFVAEKKKVSRLATSGNFYFADTEDFASASKWCFVNNANQQGNFFVSTALNYYIYQGKKVGVQGINPGSVEKLWSQLRPESGGEN
jgi:dTDP-glucose pyrophosphorylase